MSILHFDCFSGISGNMALGAFIDAGIDGDWLISELEKLGLEGYEIKISRVLKNGISGMYVDIKVDGINELGECENHNHEKKHKHKKHHHEHDEHSHDEDDHHHNHEHRNLTDIEKIIDESKLEDKVKKTAKKMFKIVAEAEAKVHGEPIEKVHFHEVGAVDSILDIVGVAICLNKIGADKITSTPVHVGSGFVKCQHGIIPVPAPATMEIIKGCQIPIYSKGIKSELMTPTGAAILGAIVEKWTEEPAGTVYKMGYGAGSRELEIPNLLRVYEMEKFEKKKKSTNNLEFPF